MALSIIIPTKNEETNIINLLSSLAGQDFKWSGSEIILADASSQDATCVLAQEYANHYNLPLKITKGGLPAIARNNGAREANNQILVFIDADVILRDKAMLTKTNEQFNASQIDLVTCNIRCNEDIRADFIFRVFNIMQTTSRLYKPCASTMYFAIRKSTFDHLGGFDERATHCEDVLLAREISKDSFAVLDSALSTYNRRFIKNGYIGFVLYFLQNTVHMNNKEYFYQDIGYWN